MITHYFLYLLFCKQISDKRTCTWLHCTFKRTNLSIMKKKNDYESAKTVTLYKCFENKLLKIKNIFTKKKKKKKNGFHRKYFKT